MIIIKLAGALGNQMFQYAAGRRLANKHGTELKLDITGYDHQAVIDTKRKFMLNVFNISAKFASDREIIRLKGKRGSFLERVAYLRLPILPNRGHYFFEKSPHVFYNEVLKLPDNAYLEGWFQMEKYFEDIADDIRKEFTYKRMPAGRNKKTLAHIYSVNSVSIHVRRGDYVTNPFANKEHGVLSSQYFLSAIKLIHKKTSHPTLFVFAEFPEDFHWIKENIAPKGTKMVFVTGNDTWHGHEDLRLMAACKHNIIANSSFSWWAAWLNSNKKKLVLTPKKWFNDPNIDTSNRIPKGWQRI